MLTQFRLSGPVGAQTRIRREDTLRTKRALSRLGFLAQRSNSVSPIANTEMIEGLRAFQRKNGLVEAGAMAPGGPSERLIRAALAERESGSAGNDTASFRVSASVGAASRNRPNDIRATKRALSRAGVIAESDADKEMAPATFTGAIESFQRSFNLKRDGQIAPGGETERMLSRAISAEESIPNRRPGNLKAVTFNETPNDVLRDFGLDLDRLGAEKKDNRDVDEIETKFRRMASYAREIGALFPAEMLDRFLSV